MNKFERVLIASIYTRTRRVEIWLISEYHEQVKKMDKKGYGGICEIVGLKEFQVKPYFDIDAKIDLDKSFDETIIDDIENDIKKYVMFKFINVIENQENMTEKWNIHLDYI